MGTWENLKLHVFVRFQIQTHVSSKFVAFQSLVEIVVPPTQDHSQPRLLALHLLQLTMDEKGKIEKMEKKPIRLDVPYFQVRRLVHQIKMFLLPVASHRKL